MITRKRFKKYIAENSYLLKAVLKQDSIFADLALAPSSMNKRKRITWNHWSIYDIDDDGTEFNNIVSSKDAAEIYNIFIVLKRIFRKKKFHIVAIWKENNHTESEVVLSDSKTEQQPNLALEVFKTNRQMNVPAEAIEDFYREIESKLKIQFKEIYEQVNG